tara:strand:- start:232 stop:585 length:354 start_codon:yes stop_codon:yes gene_type:complete
MKITRRQLQQIILREFKLINEISLNPITNLDNLAKKAFSVAGGDDTLRGARDDFGEALQGSISSLSARIKQLELDITGIKETMADDIEDDAPQKNTKEPKWDPESDSFVGFPQRSNE